MMDIAYENDVNDFHYGLSALSRYFIIDSYHTSVANRINVENEIMKQEIAHHISSFGNYLIDIGTNMNIFYYDMLNFKLHRNLMYMNNYTD